MTETYRQAFPERERGPWLSYGIPFDQAAHLHVSETLHASRVYIIASGSLSRNTDNLDKLKNALTKDRVAGLRIGMNSHTQWSEILEIVADVKRVQADVLLTIGGGTLIDGAKIVSLVCMLRRWGMEQGNSLTTFLIDRRSLTMYPLRRN
jgi:alcohol dehydrogenase class IV